MPQKDSTPSPDDDLVLVDTSIVAYNIGEKSVTENAVTSLDDLKRISKSDDKIWINISGLANRELIDGLCAHYDIHPVIIEDIANINQRPKVGLYETYIHILMKLCQNDSLTNSINKRQISFILMENEIGRAHV